MTRVPQHRMNVAWMLVRFSRVFWLALAAMGAIFSASGGACAATPSPASAGTTRLAASAPPASQVAITLAQFFSWAEQAYAVYFPGPQADQFAPSLVYRYYPDTRNYLAVGGETVFAMGPATGDQVVVLGKLADFTCWVTPQACPAPPPTTAQRAAAAQAAASSANNACAVVAPFYWEIGDGHDKLANGSVTGPLGIARYSETSSMAIASASKWLFAAYVAQRREGVLSTDDVRFLNFHSGYNSFISCLKGQTVDGCLAFPAANGAFTAAQVGSFSYGGGHMQQHASRLGLGALDNAGLAAELRSRLGSDVGLSYNQPQLAGGAQSTPQDYARFLRKLINGDLRLGALLGSQPVCTNPSTCAQALKTPIPQSESWHYSLGHWVEDDPLLGDGAFSSPGAFGFYPWIDAARGSYGVLAREVQGEQSGVESAFCGRLIRKAWATATGSP